MKRVRRLSMTLIGVTLLACNDFVPSDQIALALTAVDGKPIPVGVPATLGTSARIVWGVVATSPSESHCDYRLRFEMGNLMILAEGVVNSCDFPESGPLMIDIDLGITPGPTGIHTYRFD